jgi:hypothetical protein
METMETGRHGGVTEPGGPVTLAQILAKQRDISAAERRPSELRAERDDLIRAALRAGVTTKAELHRETGISEQHLGRIEQGRTSGARPPG